MLPCYTNQERREVLVENHAQIDTQKIENHEQTQEEDDRSEKIQEEEISLRRLSRQVQPSTRLRDFIIYSVHYPIQDYISYNHISNEHYIFFKFIVKN
jgi:hypothetical protein